MALVNDTTIGRIRYRAFHAPAATDVMADIAVPSPKNPPAAGVATSVPLSLAADDARDDNDDTDPMESVLPRARAGGVSSASTFKLGTAMGGGVGVSVSEKGVGGTSCSKPRNMKNKQTERHGDRRWQTDIGRTDRLTHLHQIRCRGVGQRRQRQI